MEQAIILDSDAAPSQIEVMEDTVRGALNQYGAGSHKPGSGSAAALLALVGCAMFKTVVALTNGKPNYAEWHGQLNLTQQAIVDDVEPFLMNAVSVDAQIWDQVIAARRAVKAAKERNADSKVIDKLQRHHLDFMKQATEMPLEIARRSVSAAEQAMILFNFGFQSARGDTAVGIASTLAASMSAIAIVYLNLKQFRRASQWSAALRDAADELHRRATRAHSMLLEHIGGMRRETISIHKNPPLDVNGLQESHGFAYVTKGSISGGVNSLIETFGLSEGRSTDSKDPGGAYDFYALLDAYMNDTEARCRIDALARDSANRSRRRSVPYTSNDVS